MHAQFAQPARLARFGRLARSRSSSIALVAGLGLVGIGCSSSSGSPGAQPPNDAATTTDAGGSPVVAIAGGMVQGHAEGSTSAFLGIPYAKPPTGALRWAPPEKPDPWSGVLDAATFGNRCAQNANDTLQTVASTDEDCLYLNVWTPSATASKLPVMVWFHGGGNTGGSASDPLPFGDAGQYLYDGAHIAANGVVVVTLNYRLGIFGFFAHPGLPGEGSKPGNQGLWDQRFAMQWVQDNIAKFGGDPGNVTIFGESAGSLDVCMHVASPQTPPLFARAISESGGCTTRQPTLAENEPLVLSVAASLGCLGAASPEGGASEAGASEAGATTEAGAASDAGDDGATPPEGGAISDAGAATATVDAGDLSASLACLRGLPVATLLAAVSGDTGGTSGGPVVPVVDGDFFADQPRTLYQGGKIAKVPYILGSNNDEGTLFEYGATPVTDQAGLSAALAAQFGDAGAAIEQEYPVSAFDGGTPNPYQAVLTQVVGDSLLVCSTYDSALLAANQGLPVWTYNFDLPLEFPRLVGPGPGEVDLGAAHGSELPYVFGTSPLFASKMDEATVSQLMERYWTRFATAGDPNGGMDLNWPKFSAADNQRMQFNFTPSVLTGFRAPQCAFWIGFYESQFASP